MELIADSNSNTRGKEADGRKRKNQGGGEREDSPLSLHLKSHSGYCLPFSAMVVTASAYTLAVIAFERYFAICRPLHSRIWQTR